MSEIKINGKVVSLDNNPTLRDHVLALVNPNLSSEEFRKAVQYLSGTIKNKEGKDVPVMASTLQTIEVKAGNPESHAHPITQADIRKMYELTQTCAWDKPARGGKGKSRTATGDRTETLG